MRCYATEFPALERDIRQQYAIAAAEWRQMSRKTSIDNRTVEIPENRPAVAIPPTLFNDTAKLVESTRKQMENVWPAGRESPECKASNAIDISSLGRQFSIIGPHLAQLFYNGYDLIYRELCRRRVWS
jgi:hypothetical protein